MIYSLLNDKLPDAIPIDMNVYPRSLNLTHLIVGQDTYTLPVEFWRRRDEILPNGVALLKGLRLYDYPGYISPFFQNTSHCFFAVTNITWEVFPLWLKFV